MPVLCEQHKLLFIMTPMTGCSAVGKALTEQLDGRYLPEEDLRDERGRVIVDHKHATYRDLTKRGVLSRSAGESLCKFATVRNPFDRLVSMYTKRSQKLQKHLDRPHSWIHRFPETVEDIRYCRDHSFDDWVQKHYSRGALDRLRGRGRSRMMLRWLRDVDCVMRFERLDDDLRDVLRRAGVTKEVSVPVFHRTRGRERDYRAMYSPRSRRVVEDTFRDVLRLFGYSFDSVAESAAASPVDTAALARAVNA